MSLDRAKIDQNDNPTWIAYNETTGGVEAVAVDPITNALYVFGVSPDGNTPTTLNNAKIDANDSATEIGYNDTSGEIEALRCGNNGELLVNIEE